MTALERLLEGNERYRAAKKDAQALKNVNQFYAPIAQQNPFAVILSCADSRVPAELIFDQGVGAIFVVRIAGNIADITQIGSIEYACDQLSPELIMVLGHSGCGAVASAIEIEDTSVLSSHLRQVIQQITPAVELVKKQKELMCASALSREIERENVRQQKQKLLHRSAIIRDTVATNNCQIVGAHYDMSNAKVTIVSDDK